MNRKSTTRFIYESPDGGKTLYRRPFGKLHPRELVITPKLDRGSRNLLILPTHLQN